MSDPLSVAASVLGMVGLCADALTTGYRIYQYCGGVQAAPDDVASLVNELEMLLPLLCKIRDLAMTNPRLESVQTFIRKDNTLDEFKKMLEGITKALNNRLGKWKGGKGKLDRLKWPLHENRFSKQISQISRIKQTFNLALSLDTAWVTQTLKPTYFTSANNMEGPPLIKFWKFRRILMRVSNSC